MFVSVVAQRLYYGAAGDDAMTCAGRVLIIVWTTRPLLLALHKFTYDVVSTPFIRTSFVLVMYLFRMAQPNTIAFTCPLPIRTDHASITARHRLHRSYRHHGQLSHCC